jgi:hypothetical protein
MAERTILQKTELMPRKRAIFPSKIAEQKQLAEQLAAIITAEYSADSSFFLDRCGRPRLTVAFD